MKTDGNPYAHIVLRGSNGKPNYAINFIEETFKYLQDGKVVNPAILVDVSHDNCLLNGKKDCTLQAKIILDVVKSLNEHPQLKHVVKGFMLESFIKEGNQNVETASSIDLGGLSITDPCLGWEKTEELLLELAKKLELK